MRNPILALSMLFLCSTLAAATQNQGNEIWQELETQQQLRNTPTQDPWVQPRKFKLFSLGKDNLEAVLQLAPEEEIGIPKAAKSELPLIDLPRPDGTYATFAFVESPVMEPELAAKYPAIRTFFGKLVGNSTVWARFDWTPTGFHAQIIGPGESWYIDPYHKGVSYASYHKKDYQFQDHPFNCLIQESTPPVLDLLETSPRSGENLITYRIAVATTGEYGQFHGGTKPLALAAVVTTINRVTGIYEYELAVRLILVANNDLITYVDASTDPFTGNFSAGTLISESQTEIDSVIGTGNYDIGHTFSTGAGGLAGLGVVCRASSKAQGVTGRSTPVGDPYDVDYVAHEIGHQFGADHTFNGTGSSCAGNRGASVAYEPGSGSTIMAYAGICGADDLQPNSDPIFHSASHDEMMSYITSGFGSTCGTSTSLNNAIPTVNAGDDYTIPTNTPFVTSGSATDADNGDMLTYLWEERDLGPASTLAAIDDGQIPLFRVYTPSTSNQRFYPQLETLVSNISNNSEKLPQVARNPMAFRLTVRDSNGGVEADNMEITVDNTSGPFLVTSPNTAEAYDGGSNITVSWNPANTNNAPISASNVDIFISTDGGLTWNLSHPLKTGVANDGSDNVRLPNINTTLARIMVKGAGNIFFDISDQNFSIVKDDTLQTFPWEMFRPALIKKTQP